MEEKVFQIIKPRAELQPYIQYYSLLHLSSSHIIKDKVLPVGHVQLILHRSNPFVNIEDHVVDNQMYVCGQYEKRCFLSTCGETDEISVVLQPWAAGMILHIPAEKFLGQKISINDLEDDEFKLLYNQVYNSDNYEECIKYIEQFLIRRVMSYKASYYINPLRSVLDVIDREINPNLNTLADKFCLSSKQFGRVFLNNVGVSAKTLSRIIRFQKSLRFMKLNPSATITQVAYEFGYTDQSHFTKEFQHFALESPKEFMKSNREINIYSDYFAVKE